jgi:hypothetical protein
MVPGGWIQAILRPDRVSNPLPVHVIRGMHFTRWAGRVTLSSLRPWRHAQRDGPRLPVKVEFNLRPLRLSYMLCLPSNLRLLRPRGDGG